MKPDDEKKFMELLERDLVKQLEERYGRTAAKITQARKLGIVRGVYHYLIKSTT